MALNSFLGQNLYASTVNVQTLRVPRVETVTQETSRDTAVTSNGLSADIVTTDEALGDGDTVAFAVDCASFDVEDSVLVQLTDGVADLSEVSVVVVTEMAEGSFTLACTNHTGSALSYVIIKRV
jgi:hypothetical protein